MENPKKRKKEALVEGGDSSKKQKVKKEKKKKKKSEDVAPMVDGEAVATTEKKSNKSKGKAVDMDKLMEGYDDKVKVVNAIAKPLASERLTKKLLKLTRKAVETKSLRRGVKETLLDLKKGGTGLCILAGNITPVDIIAHIPILCEEKDVPYIWVPSKQDLGLAHYCKRPCSVVLCKHGSEAKYQKLYGEVVAAVAGSKV